jgi:putative phosphotransacetylase
LSARHAHLSQEHVEALFGPGHRLRPQFDLSQPGQFAAVETVELVGPRRSIPGVRVLGPARAASQVELSVTDGVTLGINLPVRVSGNVAGTPGVHLIGPRGAVKLNQGCLVAARHLHATPQDAARLGLRDRQKVYVRFPGPRGLIYNEVVVRISEAFATELHLDTDEGNAAGIGRQDRVEVIPSLCDDLCTVVGCPIAPQVQAGVGRPFCSLTSDGITIQ